MSSNNSYPVFHGNVVVMIKYEDFQKRHSQPILEQFSISIPPENVRKPHDIFRGYRYGTLFELINFCFS